MSDGEKERQTERDRERESLLIPQPLTLARQTSTTQNVPDRPIPALQCTTAGPTSGSSTPELRTAIRNSRKTLGVWGTPKSGQRM